MKIPLLDLNAQHKPIHHEIMEAIERVVQSQNFILGAEVVKLEESVAAYSGAKFGIGVSSGTDALLLALMALDIGPGDEVITTPYSFFATAGAVVRLGARPVFVDIDPVTYNIDPKKITAAITPKTKAIIPVHLYGQCADMAPIMQIAKEHNLKVIEDGAQAIGTEYSDGKRAGSMGDIGCFSFFPSKNLGAMGDAGMVTTSDPALYEKIQVLRVHGSKPKYYHKMIGGNFRIDAIQAAILNVKLKYLDSWTEGRQKNAEVYRGLFGNLVKKGKVNLPEAVYKSNNLKHYHIYNQFIIRVNDRDKLHLFLKEKDIVTEIYYPVPFHLQECFKYLNYQEGDFPQSEKAAKETLALPIYPELTEAQQKYVVRTIEEFMQSQVS